MEKDPEQHSSLCLIKTSGINGGWNGGQLYQYKKGYLWNPITNNDEELTKCEVAVAWVLPPNTKK